MAHGLSPSVGSDEDSQSIPGVSCEEGFEHRMGVSLERIVRSLGEARVHELCDHCGEGAVPPTLCVERVLGDEYFCSSVLHGMGAPCDKWRSLTT